MRSNFRFQANTIFEPAHDALLLFKKKDIVLSTTFVLNILSRETYQRFCQSKQTIQKLP